MCGSSSERRRSETRPTSGKSAARTAARTRNRDWALFEFKGGSSSGRAPAPLSSSGRVRRNAHVLEAAVDGERDDHGARPEPFRETVRADDVRPGRDAGEDALLLRKAQGHGERLVVLDRLDVVDLLGIPVRHDEAGPALDQEG